MTTVQHAATCAAQAPAALIAVGQHCADHDLTAPHTIEVPTLGDDEMRIHLVNDTAPAWLRTVTVVDRRTESTHLGDHRVFVEVLLPVGVRVTLRYTESRFRVVTSS